MKQFSSDIRYVEATPRKQRKKSGAYSVISAGVSSSADNSALKSYVDSNFMSLATGQDVSALHNFLNGFNIAGIPFRKMANGSLFIDANVVFGGGATMYGTDTTSAPSIFDGLPIDNETIYWDNGVLKAMGGGGGGVADSVAWANVYGKPTWITNTKPTYNYSEIQGTPDLSVYFLTSNFTKANIKSILGISDWALASSLEWGAINSKPTDIYGYGMSEKLTNLNNATLNKFFSSSFQASNRPAYNYAVGFTLGNGSISANYAAQLAIDYYGGVHTRYKASTEWSEWVELAPLSSIPSLTGYATETFVNTALAGYLPLSGGTMKRSAGIYNESDPNTNYGAIGFNYGHNAFGSPYFPTKLRSSTDLTVTMGSAEFTLLHSGNYSTLLANGTINGSITATSFIGDLAGQATAASLLRKTTSNSWCVANGNALDIYNSNASKRFWFGYSLPEGSPYATNEWHFGASDGTGENSGKVYAASFIGNLTGNANSATKLATPRTIWGQSFDGTGNILADKGVGLMSTQNYYGLSILPDTSVYGVRTFLTYDEGSTMGAYEISASYAVGGLSIGVATGLEYNTTIIPSSASYTPIVVIKKNGNVVIGGTAASAKLHVYGNLLTEGGITMYSQRSLKNILSYDGLSLEQLSVIKPIKFTWKDGRDNRYHVGGVADDMATVVPEVVYSANDFLTMDYGNAGFYVAASLIKPVIYCHNKVEEHDKDIDYLKRENVAIKKENKALRDEINQLKQVS